MSFYWGWGSARPPNTSVPSERPCSVDDWKHRNSRWFSTRVLAADTVCSTQDTHASMREFKAYWIDLRRRLVLHTIVINAKGQCPTMQAGGAPDDSRQFPDNSLHYNHAGTKRFFTIASMPHEYSNLREVERKATSTTEIEKKRSGQNDEPRHRILHTHQLKLHMFVRCCPTVGALFLLHYCLCFPRTGAQSLYLLGRIGSSDSGSRSKSMDLGLTRAPNLYLSS